MPLKYIDIHTHVNFKVFDEDREAVLERALANDTWIINVGTQVDTSKKAIEIANQHKEGVYAIVGLHPIHTDASFHDQQELGSEGEEFSSRGEIFDKNIYREFLKDPKVVAIGECGLDYYRCTEESVEKQKQAFVAQIELAEEVGKPLMLHLRNNPKDKERNAYTDALLLLKKFPKVKGDVHFFAGSVKEAEDFLNLGFTLSFTGVITFTHDYDEVLKIVPLNMIMSETDAPYVAPVPHRGKRNEPSYVREIVKKIAEVKNLREAEVAEAIVLNAKRVFGI
jgi:TatD DNase family protein